MVGLHPKLSIRALFPPIRLTTRDAGTPRRGAGHHLPSASSADSRRATPVAPHDFCVASSLQGDIFSSRSNAVYRTLTRFKDTVCCTAYRHDGKMLAASDERGWRLKRAV